MPNGRRAFFLAIKILNSHIAGVRLDTQKWQHRLHRNRVIPIKTLQRDSLSKCTAVMPLYLKRYGGDGGSRTRVWRRETHPIVRALLVQQCLGKFSSVARSLNFLRLQSAAKHSLVVCHLKNFLSRPAHGYELSIALSQREHFPVIRVTDCRLNHSLRSVHYLSPFMLCCRLASSNTNR
jgi:hypothetical protein